MFQSKQKLLQSSVFQKLSNKSLHFMAYTGVHSANYGRIYSRSVNHHCGYNLDIFQQPENAERFICTMYET